MSQWWKNPDEMSGEKLLQKAADCWERGNAYTDADRAGLARAAYTWAGVAIAALNRKGLAFVPFTSADKCWCQPFDGPKHLKCPMHGKPVPMTAASVQAIVDADRAGVINLPEGDYTAAQLATTTQVPTQEATSSGVRVSGLVRTGNLNATPQYAGEHGCRTYVGKVPTGHVCMRPETVIHDGRMYCDEHRPAESYPATEDVCVSLADAGLPGGCELCTHCTTATPHCRHCAEPIQTVSLAAIAPKRFAVVNLATDDQPQGFDTLEEARMHVASTWLTDWEIWDGDTLVDHRDPDTDKVKR